MLTRFVLRRMLAKGLKGRIVNVTSICAQRGFPGLVAYSATKGGMDAATRSLARELGGRVLANAVAPGFFASEMSAVLGQTQLDQIVRRTPTGHLTEPDEVVPVVRMLLLDNTNINGQVLVDRRRRLHLSRRRTSDPYDAPCRHTLSPCPSGSLESTSATAAGKCPWGGVRTGHEIWGDLAGWVGGGAVGAGCAGRGGGVGRGLRVGGGLRGRCLGFVVGDGGADSAGSGSARC